MTHEELRTALMELAEDLTVDVTTEDAVITLLELTAEVTLNGLGNDSLNNAAKKGE